MTLNISEYIASYKLLLPNAPLDPWDTCNHAEEFIQSLLATLSDDYKIEKGIAIHKTALVENPITIKAPCIIGPHCFVAAYSYLRGGVWLEANVIIGPATEVKSSFLFRRSKLAHLNFIGNTIIGNNVNIEAGAIIANYRNESKEKQISCLINNKLTTIPTEKFGALVGDNCKVGANAVLAPGTILKPNTIVNRLELIDQTQ